MHILCTRESDTREYLKIRLYLGYWVEELSLFILRMITRPWHCCWCRLLRRWFSRKVSTAVSPTLTFLKHAGASLLTRLAPYTQHMMLNWLTPLVVLWIKLTAWMAVLFPPRALTVARQLSNALVQRTRHEELPCANFLKATAHTLQLCRSIAE